MDKFPAPKFTKLIDKDPQIVKVDLDYPEWGSRASGQPKEVKNEMRIVHVNKA